MANYIPTYLQNLPSLSPVAAPATSQPLEKCDATRTQKIRDEIIKAIEVETTGSGPIELQVSKSGIDRDVENRICNELKQLGWNVHTVDWGSDSIFMLFPTLNTPTIPDGWKEEHSAKSVQTRIEKAIRNVLETVIKRVDEYKNFRCSVIGFRPIPPDALLELQRIIRGSERECYLQPATFQLGRNQPKPWYKIYVINRS